MGSFWPNCLGLLAILVLILSIKTFNKSTNLSHLSAVDEMYFEILNIGLDNPDFRNAEKIKNFINCEKYNVYAHMVLCIVECIFYRSHYDKRVLITWGAAIDTEMQLYKECISQDKHEHIFKNVFIKYVRAYEKEKKWWKKRPNFRMI